MQSVWSFALFSFTLGHCQVWHLPGLVRPRGFWLGLLLRSWFGSVLLGIVFLLSQALNRGSVKFGACLV